MLSYESYMDEAQSIARTAHLAVLVSLSDGNDDIEICPLYPPADESTLTSQAEYVSRKLRTVCVIGLCGENTVPRIALKEHIDGPVLQAVIDAFAAYVVELIRPKVEQQAAEAEVLELSRLYLLPDTRPSN